AASPPRTRSTWSHPAAGRTGRTRSDGRADGHPSGGRASRAPERARRSGTPAARQGWIAIRSAWPAVPPAYPRLQFPARDSGGIMSLLLNVQNLTKTFGTRTLFKDISISFDDAERTGLIGPTGSGKSTLLQILASVEHYDSGTITSRRQLRQRYLQQDAVFAPGSTGRRVR